MNQIAALIKEKDVRVFNRMGEVVPVKSHSKEVCVNGKYFNMNPLELIRMVRNTTQQIGSHKVANNANSAYMVQSLRLARNQMVSDLENHFGISHVIDDHGKSLFYKL